MLEFTCPGCGKRVQGDDSLAGQLLRCPGCQATFPSHSDASTAIAEGDLAPTRPRSLDGAFNEGLPPLPSVRKRGPIMIPTTVGILVILAVIGILIALLVPSVERVRESAARTQSINNLKGVGLAALSFHETHKRMPFNGTIPAAANDAKSGSWAFQVLPHIDQAPLFGQPNARSGVQSYMCPGRGRPFFSTTGAWTDYMINPWLNDAKNGAVNARDVRRELKDIQDGSSNTIFAGHGSIDPAQYVSNVAHAQSTDIFKGGDPALARHSTTNQRDKHGDAALTWGSPFPQGIVVVFCDGTVRMIPYSFPPGAIRNGVADGGFAAFLTPSGGEVVPLPN